VKPAGVWWSCLSDGTWTSPYPLAAAAGPDARATKLHQITIRARPPRICLEVSRVLICRRPSKAWPISASIRAGSIPADTDVAADGRLRQSVWGDAAAVLPHSYPSA
jgi:hypothetical protein